MIVTAVLKDQAMPASSIFAIHGKMTQEWQRKIGFQHANQKMTVLMTFNAFVIIIGEKFTRDFAWKRAWIAEKEAELTVRLAVLNQSAVMASTVVRTPTSVN